MFFLLFVLQSSKIQSFLTQNFLLLAFLDCDWVYQLKETIVDAEVVDQNITKTIFRRFRTVYWKNNSKSQKKEGLTFRV